MVSDSYQLLYYQIEGRRQNLQRDGEENFFSIFSTGSKSGLRCLLLKIASSSVPIDTEIIFNITDF
jgi:hypothetical protein